MAEGTNRGPPRISSGNKDHLDGYDDQASDCSSCYHLQGNGGNIACVPGAWKRTIDLQYRVIGRVCSSSTLQFRHSASHPIRTTTNAVAIDKTFTQRITDGTF